MPLFHVLKCAGPLLKWFTCLITELGSHWGISGGRRGPWKETALGPIVSLEAQTQRKDGVEVELQRGLFFPFRSSQPQSEKEGCYPFSPVLCFLSRGSACRWDFGSWGRGWEEGSFCMKSWPAGGCSEWDPGCPAGLHGAPGIQVLAFSRGRRSSER